MRKKLIGWIPSILLPNNTKPKSAIIGAEATKGVLLPKSERFYTTMKFFEQLREPERSQAIINYQEVFLEHTVPTTLYDALYNGFLFVGTHQGDSYWQNILKSIENNTYFKEPELLVFGKYKVGDIVVSLKHIGTYRQVGELFTVLSESRSNSLKYKLTTSSQEPDTWRPATLEEVESYNQGVRNIADIKPKDYKESVHCTTQEEWDFVADKLKRDICYNTKWSTYENKSCVSIDYLIFGKIDNFTGYKILTFQEWCDKYGHVKQTNTVISSEHNTWIPPQMNTIDQYKEITTSVDNSIKVPTNNLSIPIPTNIVLKNKRKTIKL